MPGTPAIRRILIVDDEHSIADTLAIIFSTRGYEARPAYSAESAIDLISQWQPDSAVIDVMLPFMNGIDFSIVLNENYPDCHIVLFSGQPDTGTLLEEALKKGHSFEIMAKPLHPTAILDKIDSFFTAPAKPLTDA